MTAFGTARFTVLRSMPVQIAILVASLQLVASQTPLQLPADPATDCGLDVTKQWSRDYPQCMQSILGNGLIYNEPVVDPGMVSETVVQDISAISTRYSAYILKA